MRTILARLSEALFLTVKMLLSRVAVGVHALVLDERGRVLLVRHGYQPGWRLPGGGVDAGETPAEAIRRELEEELGLTGGACIAAGTYVRRSLWMGNLVMLYRITEGRLNFRPSWEIREILWADPAAPPPGLSSATARRLAELTGGAVSREW